MTKRTLDNSPLRFFKVDETDLARIQPLIDAAAKASLAGDLQAADRILKEAVRKLKARAAN